tara:strand:- start:131 stop:601 length:471 start_codon:yes stop_codon:yes gene_type:complete
MSFIGNIAAAQTAKVIGKYNQSVMNQQAAYDKRKAEIQGEVYEKFDKPKFVNQQKSWMEDQFVQTLRTGAEFREGETGYLVHLKNYQNQATDLAINDYNQTIKQNDLINQSILLQARGTGERLKGDMTARSEYISGAGSLLAMGYASHTAGRLVIT